MHWNTLDIKEDRESNYFRVRIAGIEFLPLFHTHFLSKCLEPSFTVLDFKATLFGYTTQSLS